MIVTYLGFPLSKLDRRLSLSLSFCPRSLFPGLLWAVGRDDTEEADLRRRLRQRKANPRLDIGQQPDLERGEH